MDDRGKSDDLVVPANRPNNAQGGAAEAGEGRGSPKGNATGETRPGPRAGQGVSSELGRVRQLARQDKDVRFTALLHHVDVDRLRAAYFALRPKAAPGVDGVTWHDYGLDLEDNLRDLHARVHGGSYRAKPSRRVYIPKPDGRQRPLGIAALEDKLLQRAVVEVLNAIYELGRAGARCRRYRRSVSPTRPPNRTCPFLSIRLSTGHAVADRDADLGISGLRRGGGPSCAGGRRPWRGDPVASIAISGHWNLGGPCEPRAFAAGPVAPPASSPELFPGQSRVFLA
jgi:RNA-directed DNA polymerase